MPMIPAMITGTMSGRTCQSPSLVSCAQCRKLGSVLLTIKSGRRTPIAEIPTPDLAVPYAAPKQVKTMAEVHPIAPKNGCCALSTW